MLARTLSLLPLGVLATAPAFAQTPEARAQAFLRQVIHLDEAQIASIDRARW
jgi:hypothetical protein